MAINGNFCQEYYALALRSEFWPWPWSPRLWPWSWARNPGLVARYVIFFFFFFPSNAQIFLRVMSCMARRSSTAACKFSPEDNLKQLFWLSSSRASSTRPLISGGQGWGLVFVPVDSTLNNWLIEITVCLLNGFVFTRTLFHANFKFKGKHSHRSISICQKTATLSFCKVVWRRYLGEVGKFLSYFVANLSKTLHINFYQNR